MSGSNRTDVRRMRAGCFKPAPADDHSLAQRAITSAGDRSNLSPARTRFLIGSMSMNPPRLSTVSVRQRVLRASRANAAGHALIIPAARGPSPRHSITSSAMESKPDGTSMPSARAVCRLMTNSNLIDCSTGRSPGLAPLRMGAGVDADLTIHEHERRLQRTDR